MKIQNLLLKLFKTSRDQAADCSSQLKYLKERSLSNRGLVVTTKRLSHYIDSFYRLDVEVGSEPIKSLEQGKILSLLSKIDLHFRIPVYNRLSFALPQC